MFNERRLQAQRSQAFSVVSFSSPSSRLFTIGALLLCVGCDCSGNAGNNDGGTGGSGGGAAGGASGGGIGSTGGGYGGGVAGGSGGGLAGGSGGGAAGGGVAGGTGGGVAGGGGGGTAGGTGGGVAGGTGGGATGGSGGGAAGGAPAFDAGMLADHSAMPGDAGPCVAGVNADGGSTLPALKITAVTPATGQFSTFAAQPPGVTSDWYIVEQRGVIRLSRNNALLTTPFLDVRGGIGAAADERGLLSMAFHPNYASNGRFFTFGTPVGGDGTYALDNADTVVEWRRSSNPDVAIPFKVRTVITLPVSATNHNGGTIKFGPDGYLYFATGDGGGGCNDDQPDAPQDISKLFGKVLRIDVDKNPAVAAPMNPFGASGDARVYHYGLRNPFRFNFDSTTFDLYIGDVGQSTYEEISFAGYGQSGLNFGWAKYEGAGVDTCAGRALNVNGTSPHTPPILSITRGAGGPFSGFADIIGGVVYRGSSIPALRGVYFFSDFTQQTVGALRYCNNAVQGVVAIQYSSIPNIAQVSSWSEGTDKEIYVTYGFTGRVGRLEAQ